ncbi:MAG: MBL fold metallo-hydrolase [Chloroflexi bacterium]|nr:MBL fold metallo-hydrolase [Chloroflexota bacterium]
MATAGDGSAVQVVSRSPAVPLIPVDSVEITTLYENIVDLGVPGEGPVERLRSQGSPLASQLLAGEQKNPFVGGHGLALLVKVTGNGMSRSLLFDAGGSPHGLVNNLDCLGLTPADWSVVVLSHGHWDHVLGLIGLEERLGRLRMPLVLHPDAFLRRGTMSATGTIERSASLSRQGLLDAGLSLTETEQPSLVLDGMVLVTGQVERTNDVETGWPAHYAERDGEMTPDPLICDDQAIVVDVRGKGLVVISGCGHAGIVNMVTYARALTGVDRVHAVMGGFHLGPKLFHSRIDPVVRMLLDFEPDVVAPAHCTGYRAAYAVYERRPDAFVQNTVGTRIRLTAE